MKTIELQLKQTIFEDFFGDIKTVFREELEKFKATFTQHYKDGEMFYTLEQTADILGITKQTLYTMNSRNEIP